MIKKKPVISRFAPSPSGIMHLGNIATALLTWLDARAADGRIVFRLEDLDPDRSSPEFACGIADDLRFLGLDWDEGWNKEKTSEYAQSNRNALYDEAFQLLLNRDMLYPCYCSRSQRLAASAPHPDEARCDGGCKCRHLSPTERAALEACGKKPAWKVKVPDKEITFIDCNYGLQRENFADSDDFIIKRSDGVYAYQLAASFDDMDMGITRVVRGRDLLSSTARQIWLINELGGTPPEYCHAPLIVSADKRKMSKRDGALNIKMLKMKYSAEEIIGMLAKYLNLSNGGPTTPQNLLKSFDWSLIPKTDIII